MTVSTPKSVLRDVYTVASRDRRSSMLDMGNEGVVNYAPDGAIPKWSAIAFDSRVCPYVAFQKGKH